MGGLGVLNRKREMAEGIDAANFNLQTDALSQILPAFLHKFTHTNQVFVNFVTLMFSNRRQSSRWSNALCPVGAADKGALCCLHDIGRSNDRGHRVAVAHAFGKDRYYWDHLIEKVRTPCIQSEAGSNLVKDQHRPDLGCDLSDSL